MENSGQKYNVTKNAMCPKSLAVKFLFRSCFLPQRLKWFKRNLCFERNKKKGKVFSRIIAINPGIKE